MGMHMETSEKTRAAVAGRNALSWRLVSVLILLVLMFDLLSVLLPKVAGMALAPGVVISIGIAFAFVIVAAVIATAAFYVRRLNLENAGPTSSPGAHSD